MAATRTINDELNALADQLNTAGEESLELLVRQLSAANVGTDEFATNSMLQNSITELTATLRSRSTTLAQKMVLAEKYLRVAQLLENNLAQFRQTATSGNSKNFAAALSARLNHDYIDTVLYLEPAEQTPERIKNVLKCFSSMITLKEQFDIDNLRRELSNYSDLKNKLIAYANTTPNNTKLINLVYVLNTELRKGLTNNEAKYKFAQHILALSYQLAIQTPSSQEARELAQVAYTSFSSLNVTPHNITTSLGQFYVAAFNRSPELNNVLPSLRTLIEYITTSTTATLGLTDIPLANLKRAIDELSAALKEGIDTPEKKKNVSVALINLNVELLNVRVASDEIKTLISAVGNTFDALAPLDGPHTIPTVKQLERTRILLNDLGSNDEANLCEAFIASAPTNNIVNKAASLFNKALAIRPPNPAAFAQPWVAFAYTITKNYSPSVPANAAATRLTEKLIEDAKVAINNNLVTSSNALAQYLATAARLLPPPVPPETGIDPEALFSALEKLISFNMNAATTDAVKALALALIPSPHTDAEKLTAVAKMQALENVLQNQYGSHATAREVSAQLRQARHELVPAANPLAADITTLLGRTTQLKKALNKLSTDPITAFRETNNALVAFSTTRFPDDAAIRDTAIQLNAALIAYLADPFSVAANRAAAAAPAAVPPAPPIDLKQRLATALSAFKSQVDSDTVQSLNVLGRRIESHYKLATTLNNLVGAFNEIDEAHRFDAGEIEDRDRALSAIVNTTNYNIQPLTKHAARAAYFNLEKELNLLYSDISSSDEHLKAIASSMKMLREAYNIPLFRPTPMRDDFFAGFLQATQLELAQADANKRYLSNPQELDNLEKLIGQYEQIAATLQAHLRDLTHQLNNTDFGILGARKQEALKAKVGTLNMLLRTEVTNIDTQIETIRHQINDLKITGQTQIAKYTNQLEQVANSDGDRATGVRNVFKALGAGDVAPDPAPGLGRGIALHAAPPPKNVESKGTDKAVIVGGKITAGTGPNLITAIKVDDIHFNKNRLEVNTSFAPLKYDAAGIAIARPTAANIVLQQASQKVDLNEDKKFSRKNEKDLPNKTLLDEFANTVAQMLAKSDSLRANRELNVTRNVNLCPSEWPTKAYLLCLELAGIKYKYTEYRDNKEVPEKNRVHITRDDRLAFHAWINQQIKANALEDGFKALLPLKQENNTLARTTMTPVFDAQGHDVRPVFKPR